MSRRRYPIREQEIFAPTTNGRKTTRPVRFSEISKRFSLFDGYNIARDDCVGVKSTNTPSPERNRNSRKQNELIIQPRVTSDVLDNGIIRFFPPKSRVGFAPFYVTGVYIAFSDRAYVRTYRNRSPRSNDTGNDRRFSKTDDSSRCRRRYGNVIVLENRLRSRGIALGVKRKFGRCTQGGQGVTPREPP